MRQTILEEQATEIQTIDIVGLLPAQLPSGKKILWRNAGEGRIEIYCDKYGVRGGQPKAIIINRHIPVCELLFEGFGLWAGDGFRCAQNGEYRSFGFSNTELELHRHFLKFVKLFGLYSDDFKVRVSVPSRLKPFLSKEESRISRSLGIDHSHFLKGGEDYTRNYTFAYVFIQSRLLGLVSKIFHNSIINIAFTKKEFAAAYIRGLIACEANVHVRTDKNNELGEINIGANDPRERAYCRKLIESLGIECSNDKIIPHDGAILIHGRTNFEKVAYWKLCDLHPKKRERFYFGMSNFKSFQYRKGEAKKLILKSLSQDTKDAKTLSEELRINIGTIKSEHLFKLVKDGVMIQSAPTKVGRVYVKFYSLTEKGEKAAEENKNIFKRR